MPNISEQELASLRAAVDELTTLNQISTTISVTMPIAQITRIIVDCCLRRIQATQGAVYLHGAPGQGWPHDGSSESVDHFKTFVRSIDPEDKTPFHLNMSLTGWMLKNRTVMAINNAATDDRLPGIDLQKIGVHSLLAAPLLTRKGLIGLLVLLNKKQAEGFTESDKRLLSIVGAQTAQVIENAQLFEEEQKLRYMESEMQVARQIQAGFLPRSPWASDGWEICGFSTPAREVGGDYFDFFDLEPHQLFVSIGDVSGKGIGAALLMANAQAILRSQVRGSVRPSVTDMADTLNRLVYQFSRPEQYITALFGYIHVENGLFEYVNAAHLPPVVGRIDGTIRILPPGDLMIGAFPDVPFRVQQVSLEPGEWLLLYTDGITEAMNQNEEQFGEDRLLEACGGDTKSYEAFRIRLESAINDFRGVAPPSDDLTFVLIRRLAK